MESDVANLTRLCMFLVGVVVGALSAMLLTLVISVFRDTGLGTAFAIQIVSGGLCGAYFFWKVI